MLEKVDRSRLAQIVAGAPPCEVWLAAIPPEEFQRRIDLGALAKAGIYPDVWDREHEMDINIEYLASNYATLRNYVETLARDAQGMLVYIN